MKKKCGHFNKVITLSLTIFSLIVFVSGCKKETPKEKDDPYDSPITKSELTSVNSTTSRIWYTSLAEAKYYSPLGILDSSYNYSPSEQNVSFSENISGVEPRIYSIYSYNGVISRFWPGVGIWTLSANGRILTLAQSSFFPEPGKTGGAYSVSYNTDPPVAFSYRRALELKHTENLPNGGKVEITFLLGCFY